MTNETNSNEDGWQPCAGEIRQFARRRAHRGRAVFAAQLAGGAAFGGFLALLVSGLLGLFQGPAGPSEFQYGGITCQDVQHHAGAYVRGELDSATAEKMRLHLRECPNCPRLIESMRNKRRNAGVRWGTRSAFADVATARRRGLANRLE